MSASAPLRGVVAPESDEAPFKALAGRLAAADRILQKERGGSALLRSCPWVTAMVFGAFAADVILHLSGGVRMAITLVFACALIAGFSVAAWFAFRRRNSLEHTARVLESRHPRLGSKLINLLQLRAQKADASLSPLTRQIAGQAVAGYAAELRDEPIEQLARTDILRQEAKRTALGLLGSLAVLALFFDITKTEIPRFLDPFGDHPPYSFTQLEISEPAADGAKVEYGGSLLVMVKVAGHRPDELFLSYFPPGHPEKTVTASMFDKGDRGFAQQIEGIHSDLILVAQTKNRHAMSRQRRIAVILTPRLEQALVKIEPPAYTGLPAVEKLFQFKNLKALEGSRITFRLQSNRPLASGHLTVTDGKGSVDGVTMEPTAEREVAATLEAKEPVTLKFSMIDRDGFSSTETWESALTVTHDLPPDVQITNPNQDTFVAMDFTARPVVEANDDYGLKTLRVHSARNGVFGEPRVIDYEKPPLHAREALEFEFQKMGCTPGDTISIFAEAIDNAPNPHLTRSKTVTLTVISAEEYNAFLRQQTDMADIEAKYSKLINDFRDLVEQQKKLGEEVEAMKKELAAARTEAEKEALQKKLDELLNRQNALDAKLNQLADTMEHFVRDKPLYDVEADLKNTLAEKAKEIRDSTQANQDAMEKIAPKNKPQAQEAPPDSPPQSQDAQKQPGQQQAGQQPPSQKMLNDFKKASDEQLARLGETEQSAEEQVIQPLEDLSLMQAIVNDINRYKELYAQQVELASQAKAYDRPGNLSREDQIALRDLAAAQKQMGNDLDAVEQKLWEDGKAAKEKFPKAGGSAQEIAVKMGDLKLQTLADRATEQMLAGNGPTGSQLAEHLRGEMEKLFTQCNSKGDVMNDEVDQYMSIQRSMQPGKTFSQMMQSHRFGQGSKSGGGMSGNGGMNGQAVITGANARVLGGESALSNDRDSKASGNGKNNTPPSAAEAPPSLDKPDVVHGVNAVNRESEAIQGESTIDQYSDIVEKYFKALTKEPKGAQKP
jgi:ElaB/YqjD/DUF883 family membrane-anchored ribosome-binding protein